MKKLLQSLRVFKRLRLLEYKQKMLFNELSKTNGRVLDIENFILRRKRIYYWRATPGNRNDGCAKGGCNG